MRTYRFTRIVLALAVAIIACVPALAGAAVAPTDVGLDARADGVTITAFASTPVTDVAEGALVGLDRVTLAANESLDPIDGLAIVTVESGEAVFIDDLGLESTLAPIAEPEDPTVTALVLDPILPADITTTERTTLRRAWIADEEPVGDDAVTMEAPEALDEATFVFAVVHLESGAGVDLETVGPLLLVADADLAASRPGRPQATLRADRGLVLGAGVTLTLTNTAAYPTTLALAGLVPSADAAADNDPDTDAGSTSSGDTSDDTRGGSSGGSDTSSDDQAYADLDEYEPSVADLRTAGFTLLQTKDTETVDDSLYGEFPGVDATAWEEGLMLALGPRRSTTVGASMALMSFDRFTTPDDAGDVITMFRIAAQSGGADFSLLDTPARGGFDEVVAIALESDSGDVFTLVVARHGSVVCITAVTAPTVQEETAIELFGTIPVN